MNYLYAGIGIVITTLVSPFIFLLSLQWIRFYSVPKDLPWAGLKNKKVFPKLRATLRDLTAGRDPIDEGYENYNKHGRAFVLPGLHWPDVVLPASNIAWLVSQPEDALSGAKLQDGFLGLSYLSHGPDLNAISDFTVIRRDLTRNLSRILPDILEETNLCFDKMLGNDSEWKEFKIVEIIEHTSRRLNNRLFIGLPLCRDKRYIDGLRAWEIALGVSSAVMRYLMPDMLRPWLMPIVAIPVRLQTWRLEKLLLPMIRQRIASQNQNAESKSDEKRPNDVLQWLMDSQTEKRASSRMSISDIAGKAILLNFFSVHTVAGNCGSILIDILCYKAAPSLISELRKEAESVIPRLDLDPRAVREMVKMDSVIRESLRLHSMGSRGLGREVVLPEGVITPDGMHLPCGSHVCITISSRQRDHDVWERGDEFVPLRFVKSEDEPIKSADKPRSAVHVTEDFLSFGYGQHACPGRFFAVPALKILLGHLLVHYDLEPLTERPEFLEFSEVVIPSDKTIVKMRRRQTDLL